MLFAAPLCPRLVNNRYLVNVLQKLEGVIGEGAMVFDFEVRMKPKCESVPPF